MTKKAGWADNQKLGGKRKGQADNGDVLVTKSASKISFAGGTVGNGRSLSAFVMSDHPLSVEELGYAPVGTARDSQGSLVQPAFNINKSGGMETADMLIWTDKIGVPSTGVTPTNRGMACLDGLGQHHGFAAIQNMVNQGLDPALRFPHGSSRGQHEDFEHFSYFKPAHEKAKLQANVEQFQAARALAASENPPREMSRAELLQSAHISNATSLRVAQEPWREAFSEEKIVRGWKKEGVVPFTRALMWELRAEEEASGITPSRVPDVDLAAFGLSAAETAITNAASGMAIVLAPPVDVGWDAGIDEEVEALLRAECGDSGLVVDPVPPPSKMPKLTSALLYKVPGGATGAVGLKLIRSKEVMRRLTIARLAYRKGRREEKGVAVTNTSWTDAAEAMKALQANSYDLNLLSGAHLKGLVRSLDVGKPIGKKADLVDLLSARFGAITSSQFAAINLAVQRGVARASLPPGLPAPPVVPALLPPTPADAPPSPSTTPLCLALSRPKRSRP